MIDCERANNEFKRVFISNIHRKNSGVLFNQLILGTDFMTAPASSKYHLAERGGLCVHSLNVYYKLKKLLDCIDILDSNSSDFEWNERTRESVAIVALLHDVCKTNMYTPAYRNVKSYEEEDVKSVEKNRIKHDDLGDYIWKQVPSYNIEEQFIFGHGEKSVYLIRQFMELTDEEAQAIRFHMGSWVENDKQMAGKVFATNRLAWLLHVADEAATYLDEGE